jgi:DNA-binding CsgD family transcriptional regulator
MNTECEPKATKGTLHCNKAASAADTRPALMRKFNTAQELPTGRSRRGQEADPLSRAFPPPPDGGGEEVCEKSGLKSTPARLVGSAMFSSPAWATIARSLQFSARELQIVRAVFDDQKENTMARALGISIHTIHTHVDRLHHKLAITDRTQLLQRVMQEFLALTIVPGCALPPICANRATGGCPLYSCQLNRRLAQTNRPDGRIA